MRGSTQTTLVGDNDDLAGVSGQLVSVRAGTILSSRPGSADLPVTDLRTGQQVGTLTINGLNFAGTVAPDNAITGLSSETNIGDLR